MADEFRPQIQGVILKFEHEEFIEEIGRTLLFYICPVCNARYAFGQNELPEVDECTECGTRFEGVEYNDQIGG